MRMRYESSIRDECSVDFVQLTLAQTAARQADAEDASCLAAVRAEKAYCTCFMHAFVPLHSGSAALPAFAGRGR
jgi:hypothetical protein